MLSFIHPEPITRLPLPLLHSSVSAGYPSPAEDYVEATLDLNDYLIPHPVSTFFMRVSGHSMERAGIFNGDLLIVDRSLTPRDGQVIVAAVDGEFTVKRLRAKDRRIRLDPESNVYPPLDIHPHQEFGVWGVVTHVVHAL